MLRQLSLGGRIDRIAASVPDFLCTGRCGGDLELVAYSSFVDKVFHYEFCHGGAADVAVADKKDTNHLKNPFFKGAKGRDLPQYAHYFSLYLLSMKNVQNCKMRRITAGNSSQIVVKTG